jgi:hypothetical protein
MLFGERYTPLKLRWEGNVKEASFRSLTAQAEAAAAAYRLQVLEIVNESTKTKRVIIKLCSDSEICLQMELGFHKGRDLDITYAWPIRWPRAEKMLNDLRPPSPYDMSGWDAEVRAEINEARNTLYPIAQLRLEHGGYFSSPNRERFEFTELNRIQPLLEEMLCVTMRAVDQQFHAYCDPDRLALLALEPDSETLLLTTPMAVGAMLVAAGKRKEFTAWKEAYTSGDLRGHRHPPVMAHYIAGFEQRLSEV